MESPIYTKEGKKSGTIDLPESIFGVSWNANLVHDVVTAMQANARTSVAHAKDRSEVRGGGRKPWRQKGTGRARHGSNRSPIWAGGGATFGPRKEKDFGKKINRRAKAKALFTVLSAKLRDGEILFVDELALPEKKTASARSVLSNWSALSGFETILSKKHNAALITTATPEEHTFKSFGNFSNVAVEEVRNLNPVDLLQYKYLVIANPKESIEFLEGKTKQVVSSK